MLTVLNDRKGAHNIRQSRIASVRSLCIFDMCTSQRATVGKDRIINSVMISKAVTACHPGYWSCVQPLCMSIDDLGKGILQKTNT